VATAPWCTTTPASSSGTNWMKPAGRAMGERQAAPMHSAKLLPGVALCCTLLRAQSACLLHSLHPPPPCPLLLVRP
jgi:hypothetical protein